MQPPSSTSSSSSSFPKLPATSSVLVADAEGPDAHLLGVREMGLQVGDVVEAVDGMDVKGRGKVEGVAEGNKRGGEQGYLGGGGGEG